MPCACYIVCTNRLDFLIYLSANCAPYGREKEKRVMMNNGGKVCAVRICDPVRLRPESGVGVLVVGYPLAGIVSAYLAYVPDS